MLRKHADAAMYEAKAAGGGVNVYGEGTADPIARLELAARLRRGIERGELELHHQPILRLAAQGYHFSRPVPAAEMTALLEASIAPERRR